MLCRKSDNTSPDKVFRDRFLDCFSLHVLMGRINLFLFNTEIYMTTVSPFFAMRCPRTKTNILAAASQPYTEEITQSPAVICLGLTKLVSNYTPLKSVKMCLVQHKESHILFLDDIWRQDGTKMVAPSLPCTLKALKMEAEIGSSCDWHTLPLQVPEWLSTRIRSQRKFSVFLTPDSRGVLALLDEEKSCKWIPKGLKIRRDVILFNCIIWIVT